MFFLFKQIFLPITRAYIAQINGGCEMDPLEAGAMRRWEASA